MDIDMSALRGSTREGDLLPAAGRGDRVGPAHRLPAHRGQPAARARGARPQDRPRDRVGDGDPDDRRAGLREYDDTPPDFGRIAATTAKQVILQRLRDAEDERRFGEYAGREGDIVTGVVQQGTRPAERLVDLGKLEAVLPRAGAGAGRDLPARHAAALLRRAGGARACAARRSRCRARTPTW